MSSTFDRNKILVAVFSIVAAGVATYLARKELKKMDFEIGDFSEGECSDIFVSIAPK